MFDQDEMDELVARGYTLNDVLMHYGVPGMKWGQRKKRASLPQSDDAEEHTRARQLHTVAKKKGTRKLSNKDLEDLNKRLNLEQNYSNLTQKTRQKTVVSVGAGWVQNRVSTVGNSMVDEIIKANVKNAVIKGNLVPKSK